MGFFNFSSQERSDEYLSKKVAIPEEETYQYTGKFSTSGKIIAALLLIMVLAAAVIVITNPGAGSEENLQDVLREYSDDPKGFVVTFWDDGFSEPLGTVEESDTVRLDAFSRFMSIAETEHKGTDNTVMYGAEADYYSVSVELEDGSCYFHISEDGEYMDYKGHIYKVNNREEVIALFEQALPQPAAE